ncbi:hypothetical protein HID58_032399 [Brassica napus]|uniref:Uncharacterized protein n=1 Tax=Brassica napus TaxID=3708 RepID=A0ABQ8BWD9_BRANA|nr:uncharacterized protein LOC106366323 [Brassica napus]KAH0909078.1 hypothetical protein HID58_032399 [Brassica napus]
MEEEKTLEMEEGRRRPGVLVVGSSGVGKRTLLSRLISVDFEDSSSQTEFHDWTINTKYYSADVSVWVCDDFSLPQPQAHSHPLVALVMVFDLNQLSTLVALQDWASHADISSFDILLCIGNKVDLVPHHPAHAEYRRRLSKASTNLYSDIDDEFGISQSEGSSLLGSDDTSSLDIRGTCLEWCRDNNIEFIEACASNPDFDKCLSVDGDCQGVDRLFGALSAHMWPGMILKSGDKINDPVLPPHGEDLSEEESEYELEYEVLSSGSADPWENIDERWVSADAGGSTSREVELDPKKVVDDDVVELGSSGTQSETVVTTTDEKPLGDTEDNNKVYELEDVEQLMSEIGNIRDNLRLMPDFQRREIAANLAMKMASMFGGGGDDSDNEEESE